MTIKNKEALNERADNLGTFNGIKLVLVTLGPAPVPTQAILETHFYNSNQISSILNDFNTASKQARDIFPITGGHRILGGPLTGQVQVVEIEPHPTDGKALLLTVEPIGDYSTYTLSVVHQNIDPIFSEIRFKFRPGCFNNCPPDWEAPSEPKPDPAIDYLAKDYDSFRHTLISWMINRVPGWEPTSEADLDQVLLELFSVAADELSDYQDRVMNEAYLATARERVSLARHARLMDYHIHQGNQASTWLALKVNTAHQLQAGFQVGAGEELAGSSSVVFITRHEQETDPLLNDISLYTWSDSVPALAAGSTGADLKFSAQADAEKVQDLIRDGEITHLLIEECLNPLTGEARGRDPTRRQLLKLHPGDEGAEAREDPVTGEWFVRVRWEEKDKLKSNYCFTVDCTDGKVHDVSLFQGNLVPVYHGQPRSFAFKDPETLLTNPNELHYERIGDQEALCRLLDGPLAYQDTLPGGETPPESTLEVEVEVDGQREPWDEVISLIHSDASDEMGDHFVVETDEEGRGLLRFGNGTNGKKLPEDAIVHCTYQVALGLDGNVGADSLQNFDKGAFPEVGSCWNPFDVTNGRAPEPVAEIIRRVPEAYRHRQLRAVTLKDYVDRAEEFPGVSRASARYMWTGSWRTVRVTIDPVGTTTLTPELREDVARYLDAVRLIGEDLEIRPPQFVPLDILVSLCIAPDHWPEDVRFVLEQELSDGYTSDGRMAFFHPDRWTFGQGLWASQIIGRVQSVEGVDYVIGVKMKRWNEATPGTPDLAEVRPNEILQVRNDPDHMERGFIKFDLKGGRQ
jgi:Baseplate J-like protein